MKFEMFFLVVVSFVFSIVISACATLPVKDLPISDATKIDVAVEAGCATAVSIGCFGNQPDLSAPKDGQDIINQLAKLVGSMVDVQMCKDNVSKIIDEKKLTIDIGALTSKKMSCQTFLQGLGIK